MLHAEKPLRASICKIRKILNIYGGQHSRADTNRLYASQNKGRRGLKQVEYTILSEQMALTEHINNKCLTELLLNAAWQSNYIQEWKSKQLHGQYLTKITETTNNERTFD